jgi:hypothetical protein
VYAYISFSLDTVTAHHDYEAQQDDELSFQTGDLITVTDQSNADWWMGTKQKDGSSGFFPSNVRNHVQCILDLTLLTGRSVSYSS